MLSNLAKKIKGSPTLSITSKAKSLKAAGHDIISMAAGEPDFDTPDFIKKAAIRALDNGVTKYTPASGTIELKNAVIRKLSENNGLEYSLDEIMINCGAKHSLFNIIMCLAGQDDEVLLPAPYWVSYPEMITAAGARPKLIPTYAGTGFKITGETLQNAISDRTRILILNSPSNPTGAVYSRKELEDISRIIAANRLFVISDEIYEYMVYDSEFSSIAQISEELKARTVLVNGLSKSYSMTGWRIGYSAGPKEIIAACSRLQSHSTSNPTSFAQSGGVEALTNPEGKTFISAMVDEFRKRRDYLYGELDSIKGISITAPQGAFYIFPDISGLLNEKISSSQEFAEKILSEELLAVIPGEGFGAPGFIRLSYAASMDDIRKAVARIKRFINNYC